MSKQSSAPEGNDGGQGKPSEPVGHDADERNSNELVRCEDDKETSDEPRAHYNNDCHSSEKKPSKSASQNNHEGKSGYNNEGNSIEPATLNDGETQSDVDLIAESERLFHDDSIVAALVLLRQVKDKSLLTSQHEQMILMGEMMEKSRDVLLAPPEKAGWKKQKESHGRFSYQVHYKILSNGSVECRIDSPVDSSLYVPFLAVLNESDLYASWIPSWRYPFKVGVTKSVKLKQQSRVNQVVQILNDFGPFLPREVILWGFADVAVHASLDSDRTRMNGVKLVSLQTNQDDDSVPPVEKGTVRMDFDGALLFQPCGDSWWVEGRHAKPEKKTKDEKLMLLTFTMSCDPKLNFVPKKLLNFCMRVVVGSIWQKMLHVAEEVRDGKRPEFTERIESKRGEVYDWMEERAKLVLSGNDNDG